MAEKDMIIQRKNADGSYTSYYPKTKAKNVEGIGEMSTLKTTEKSSLVGAINELFTSASDGKTKIATAITGKGVDASSSDTFPVLADKIGQIKTGYSSGDIVHYTDLGFNEIPASGIYNDKHSDIGIDNEGYLYIMRSYASTGGILMKYTSNYDVVWTIELDKGNQKSPKHIAIDNNNNIFVSYYGKFVEKYNSDGVLLWSNNKSTYNTSGLAVDDDGNVYLTDNSSIVKISSDGSSVRYSNHSSYGYCYSLDVTKDGGVYFGSSDGYLRYTDFSGTTTGKKLGSTSAEVIDVYVAKDGYIYAGTSYAIYKLDSNRNILWQASIRDFFSSYYFYRGNLAFADNRIFFIMFETNALMSLNSNGADFKRHVLNSVNTLRNNKDETCLFANLGSEDTPYSTQLNIYVQIP